MKLLTLLKSLQPEEYKEFERFLQSPFFKVSEHYLKFFKDLRRYHPDFELDKEALEVVYRRCFGAKSLTTTKLHNLMSGMSRQVEDYLVVRMVIDPEHRDQALIYDQLLVKSLGIRNMGRYFRGKADALAHKISNQKVSRIDDFLALQQLYHQIYYNPDTSKFVEEPSPVQLAVEQLDLYYCMAKLRYAAEMMARARILNIQFELPLLDVVLLHCKDSGFLETHPLLAIYHQLVSLYLQGVDELGFRDLKQAFTDEFPDLPREDQTLLLRHLINCGISLMSQDCAVEAEMFYLYQLAIAHDMLLDGKRITHLGFVNVVNFAALCGAFEWARDFIQRFSPFLEENKREPSIDLAEAGLYYMEGRLDEAQTSLSGPVFSMSSFDLLSRGLLLKIAFDRFILQQKDFGFLIAHYNAYERYVQSRQLTSEKKSAQLNYIKFARRMTALKFEKVKVLEVDKEALRKKLKQLKPLVSRRWLEERIERL